MKEIGESERNNPEFWLNQITPESREIARRAGELREAAFSAITSATPIDPESGESGTFFRFEFGQRFRPVYRTISGKEFFTAESDTEEV